MLGRPIQDAAHLPQHAVVIARQQEPGIASGGQASCSFKLVLTQPAVVADQQGLLEVGCRCCWREDQGMCKLNMVEHRVQGCRFIMVLTQC